MRAKVTLICLTLLVGLLALAGDSLAQAGPSPAAGTGALTGTVNRWPTSPVERPGAPQPHQPAAGVRLMIYGLARQEIASVITDDAGRFRVALPPGTYRVELAPGQGRVLIKDLPATVAITPSQETRLHLLLDTGLR